MSTKFTRYLSGGAVAESAAKHPYMYADHGNCARYHRARSINFWWDEGRLYRSFAKAECSQTVNKMAFSDEPPVGLEACPRCFPVTVNVTSVTVTVGAA